MVPKPNTQNIYHKWIINGVQKDDVPVGLDWIGGGAGNDCLTRLQRTSGVEPANVTLFSFPLPFNFQTDSYRVLQNIVISIPPLTNFLGSHRKS